jgi:hypothetical protein
MGLVKQNIPPLKSTLNKQQLFLKRLKEKCTVVDCQGMALIIQCSVKFSMSMVMVSFLMPILREHAGNFK